MNRDAILSKLARMSAACMRANGLSKPPAVDMSHDPHDVEPDPSEIRPTLRQKRGPKLNKTEAAFAALMRSEHPGHVIREQSITLILANGVRYTPDICLDGFDFYEVKGFMRDDAAVKLKVAASQFTEYRFHLVHKDKSSLGGWRIEEVLS